MAELAGQLDFMEQLNKIQQVTSKKDKIKLYKPKIKKLKVPKYEKIDILNELDEELILQEHYDEHQCEILRQEMKIALLTGKLKYKLTVRELKDWFCYSYMERIDLADINNQDLKDIAKSNGILLN